MKKILLSFILLTLGNGVFAQTGANTCANASNITSASGATTLLTCSALTGTYNPGCFGSPATTPKAKWFKYTPTSNGEITISSDIADNPIATTDTRLSLFSGTCAALTCLALNDDVDGSTNPPNYRSSLTYQVTSGTTYYIQWDSRWSATTFKFNFTFTSQTCIRPSSIYSPLTYTTTDAQLVWSNAIGAPANYDVDWSVNFADAPGNGTIVSFPAEVLGTTAPFFTAPTLAGLPDSTNFRYYVRSDCGGEQSSWQGPRYGYLAVPLPWSTDFEDASKNYTDGFFVDDFYFGSTDSTDPSFYGDGGAGNFVYTYNSTTAVTDDWAYSRALSLTAGEEVTVTFTTKSYAITEPASEMTLDITMGTTQFVSTTSPEELIGTVVVNDDTQYITQSATWIAPADGIYYMGLHNISDIGATDSLILIDNIEISTQLSTNSFLASKLSVYPNPATNVVNISSTVNATINSVEMTDLNGRIVMTKSVNATQGQIAIGDLATGMYMMKISTDQGVATKKIIKE